VVAFSNTDGGLILVGIADDGSIMGCSQNQEDLLKMIHDSIDPPPQKINISGKSIGSSKIIVVEIPEGDNPPYQSKRDKNMYVRHNANDMRTERSELMELIEQHENNQNTQRWQ
jgi:ATP-dependent DNA helicase RecG